LGIKGIIFTLDSLVAFGILVVTVSIFIYFSAGSFSPFLGAQQLHAISEDVLTILSESKLEDVVSQNLLNQYLSSGTLNQEDLKKITIDVIGALWVADKKEEVGNITNDILEDFLPKNMGYEILMDEEVIYNSSDTTRPNYEELMIEISSGRIASGYEKYKPTSGYVARALAVTVRKNTSLVFMGDVISSSVSKEGGGNNLNEVNISYEFDLPQDATILDAYWFIESAWANNKFKAYLNGQYIPGSDGRTNVLLEDLEGYIQPGHNIGNVIWRWGGGVQETGGDDGATHIVVIYNTTLLSTLENFKKINFQTVISNCSINYKKPVFIPGDIQNLYVRMNFTNETQIDNVTLKFMWQGDTTTIGSKAPNNGVVEWDDTEIRNVLNSIGISYDVLSSRYFWFIANIDNFQQVEERGYERRIDGNYSYIAVNYTENPIIYNFIDISRTIENYNYSDPDVWGFYKYVKWNFNLTNKIPLMARWQFPWLYYEGSDPIQLARANDIVLYNHDPGDPSSDPLIIEFARFGYDTSTDGVLIDNDNKFELNFSNGYAVNPTNSLGEVTFLIPASVGYGDVFENETNATDDAIQRLEDLLGEDVSAVDINVDSISVAGIPFMWGPANIRVGVWV